MRDWWGMAEGTSLGTMRVVESTPQRLVLKGSGRYSLFLILAEVVMIGGGLLAWGEKAVAHANARRGIQQRERNRSVRRLVGPVLGAMALVAGVSGARDGVPRFRALLAEIATDAGEGGEGERRAA